MCSHRNISHFHFVNLTDSNYSDTCWMIIDDTYDFTNSTSNVYSNVETVIAGLCTLIESIFGLVLNLLVVLALLKNDKLRKEYLTPAIVSLAVSDLLYSMYTLPVLSIHFFTRWPN